MAGYTTTGASSGGSSGQAQEKAQQVAGQAQEKASEVVGQAQEKAQEVAGQARSQLRTQIEQRSSQAGEQLGQQASDIRSVSETLREKGQERPAQFVDQAASRIEGLADYLRRSDSGTILHDIEDFGRQRPSAVIAVGLGLGFVASRFLKASASERYTQRYASRPQGLPSSSYDRPAGYTPPATGVSGGGTLSSGVLPDETTTGATRTGQPLSGTTDTVRTRLDEPTPGSGL